MSKILAVIILVVSSAFYGQGVQRIEGDISGRGNPWVLLNENNETFKQGTAMGVSISIIRDEYSRTSENGYCTLTGTIGAIGHFNAPISIYDTQAGAVYYSSQGKRYYAIDIKNNAYGVDMISFNYDPLNPDQSIMWVSFDNNTKLITRGTIELGGLTILPPRK